MENEISGAGGGLDEKDMVYASKPHEILLQLLVFEHATGDVTVQTEVGRLDWYTDGKLCPLLPRTTRHFVKSANNIREAIDKAVAEQFGQRPEPPYIERNGDEYHLVAKKFRFLIPTQEVLDALGEVFRKTVEIMDASESQPVSTWTKVLWTQQELAKETAFTVWRLTVTR